MLTKSIQDFSNKIGTYISYVLLEATRPEGGAWTAHGFKTNDPRMKNLELLRKTWLTDIIDQNFILQIFLQKYALEKFNYQTLLQMFESTFPDIYKKIVFYENNTEWRRLNEENKKTKEKEANSRGRT